jgi:hypothetical protein
VLAGDTGITFKALADSSIVCMLGAIKQRVVNSAHKKLLANKTKLAVKPKSIKNKQKQTVAKTPKTKA